MENIYLIGFNSFQLVGTDPGGIRGGKARGEFESLGGGNSRVWGIRRTSFHLTLHVFPRPPCRLRPDLLRLTVGVGLLDLEGRIGGRHQPSSRSLWKTLISLSNRLYVQGLANC